MRTGTRTSLASCIALLPVALTAAVGAGEASSAGRAREAAIGSNFFDPPKLTIRRGERVRWVWEAGTQRHDVTVRRGPERFRSPLRSAGSYARSFRKPGTFKLYCTQHSGSMRMTLVVRR